MNMELSFQKGLITMPNKKPNFFRILKEAGSAFIDDNATKLSASLSYYTVFAIGPLLLLIISLTGLFVDKQTIAASINSQVQSLVGAQAADQIVAIIGSLQKQQGAARWSSVLSGVTLFIGAT